MTSKEPQQISFHVKEKDSATEAFGSIRASDPDHLAVFSFTLRPLPPNAQIVDVALDEAERQRVIDGAIVNLKEYYLYPELAGKMAKALLKDESRDDESPERDGGAFAFSLTRQLRNISHDKHLEVIYNPFKVQQPGPGAAAGDNAHDPHERQRANCGIESAKILTGNIGYLKVSAHPSQRHVQSEIRNNGGVMDALAYPRQQASQQACFCVDLRHDLLWRRGILL